MTPDMAAQEMTQVRSLLGVRSHKAKDPVTAYQAIFELWNQ